MFQVDTNRCFIRKPPQNVRFAEIDAITPGKKYIIVIDDSTGVVYADVEQFSDANGIEFKRMVHHLIKYEITMRDMDGYYYKDHPGLYCLFDVRKFLEFKRLTK